MQCMFGSKLKARLSRKKLIRLSSVYPLLVSKDGAWHEEMAFIWLESGGGGWIVRSWKPDARPALNHVSHCSRAMGDGPPNAVKANVPEN